jgi:AmmeMemoRadiSam system protein B
MPQAQTRKSRFAGSFYPGTEAEIKKMLDVFRERAGEYKKGKRPPILILPHAGWIYSGFAAVRGLLTLKEDTPSRIVLIGPSHRHYYLGFSPAGYEKYATPLGELAVDLVLQDEIVDQTGFQFEPEAHENEHSVEVILPMLQYVIPGDYKILPILAGSVSKGSIEQLVNALAGLLDPLRDTLIISSDLSHFFQYEKARSLDQETLDYVLKGDEQKLMGRSEEGGRLACGYAGLVVATKLAKKWELGEPELLIYYNSGDSGGDKSSVVGYASVAYPPPSLDGV